MPGFFCYVSNLNAAKAQAPRRVSGLRGSGDARRQTCREVHPENVAAGSDQDRRAIALGLVEQPAGEHREDQRGDAPGDVQPARHATEGVAVPELRDRAGGQPGDEAVAHADHRKREHRDPRHGPQREQHRAAQRPQVRADGNARHREAVGEPAAAQARSGDRTGDHRGRGERERGLAAVGAHDAGDLAHHQQARRGGEEEHHRQAQEHRPVLVAAVRGAFGRVVHADVRGAQQPGRERAAGEDHDAEGEQRRAQAERADAPADQRRADHRAERVQAHHVAVGEAPALGHHLVDALLHDDEADAGAEAEQHAVADRELRVDGRGGGEQHADSGAQAAAEGEPHRRDRAVQARREVHAEGQRDRGEREHRAHLHPPDLEQRLHRREEHAERVDRAERQVQRGRGAERGENALRRRHAGAKKGSDPIFGSTPDATLAYCRPLQRIGNSGASPPRSRARSGIRTRRPSTAIRPLAARSCRMREKCSGVMLRREAMTLLPGERLTSTAPADWPSGTSRSR